MDFDKYLRKKNLKVTKARIAILDIVFNNTKGSTAEEIFENCKKFGVNINQSTVYRALEIFTESNILDKYPDNEGTFVYVVRKEAHKHILQCSICHKEVEVECPFKQIEVLLEDKTGFKLTDHKLIMEGICEECNNENKLLSKE